MTTENSNIFTTQETPNVVNQVTPPANSSPNVSTLPPEVLEFVGAGKKYSTVEDAIKSVPHAQNHIKNLTDELAKAKEELDKRRTTESILEELKNSSIGNTDKPTVNSLTQEEVKNIINQTLGQKEVELRTVQNVNTVKENLTAKFGDKAEAEYIKIAQDSGLSIQDLNKLSATSPNVVLKLAGLVEKKDNTTIVSKPTGTVNTQSFNQTQNQGELSARVKTGASTRDMVNSWKIAGMKVGKENK